MHQEHCAQRHDTAQSGTCSSSNVHSAGDIYSTIRHRSRCIVHRPGDTYSTSWQMQQGPHASAGCRWHSSCRGDKFSAEAESGSSVVLLTFPAAAAAESSMMQWYM